MDKDVKYLAWIFVPLGIALMTWGAYDSHLASNERIAKIQLEQARVEKGYVPKKENVLGAKEDEEFIVHDGTRWYKTIDGESIDKKVIEE